MDDRNLRILIIDAHEPVHAEYREALCPTPIEPFEVDAVSPAHAGFRKVEKAHADGAPYAVAFVDQLETVPRLLRLDPELQVVLCSTSFEPGPEEMTERLGRTDRVLVLKQPFEGIEIRQLAAALTEKRHVVRSLAEMNAELRHSNSRMELEIRQRQRAEDRLRHDALHDGLTDLPNRALLIERIERAIVRSKRDSAYRFAVIFIDLDNFKTVNDTFGHRAGDELLIEVARRLEPCFRALDTAARPADDTTARLGGDEFVALLDGIRSTDDAVKIAARIQETLTPPFMVGGAEIKLSASMGIATNELGYDDAHEILCDADTALYEAKSEGRNCAVVFSRELHARVMARVEMEKDLQLAIERRQLALVYQPIVSLITGRIEGFEALLRWHNPERGLVAPGVFIPVAEETGLISSIGDWVLREVCQQASIWTDVSGTCPAPSISINVSSRQLESDEFVDRIREMIGRFGFDAGRLRLEINESLLVDPGAETTRRLEVLRDIDVQVQLDDFGSGYSSLSVLHDLPVDAIKIDRGFVRDMSLDGKHAATIQALVVLARNRGFKIIAEGVETIDQLVQLQGIEVDHAQGFYFSKPLDARDARTLLESGGAWRGFAA
jgi:diguanylate cyclase (GGDEF)-like protein